jgi:hypothetical protein
MMIVDEGFERHAETPGVTEDRMVPGRNACRPRIEVKSVSEARLLKGPSDLLDAIAPRGSSRPRPPMRLRASSTVTPKPACFNS